jgi:predicted P-loop ATPase
MKQITNIDLIIKILNSKSKKYVKFNTIKLNIKTGKIEIEDEKFPSYLYDEILEICKSKYPSTKFSKSDVKNAVEKYAFKNKYLPENKEYHRTDKSDWYAQLEFDKDDNPKKTLNNVICFFKNYPIFKNKFYYNEFTSYETYDDELIRDFNISNFRSICEKEIGFESKDKVECAVQCLTHENSYNPFIDAIDELLWDGEERFETFFIDFIGVHDTKLNHSLTKKWFFAMMKRLYEPGCPFDNMLIIYDAKQGTGKSKIIQRLIESLGIKYGYDTSITCDNKDKDNVDKLNRTWVVGIDEMNEFLKKNPEQTKQFLAQTFDTARLSYAKRSEQYLRHCVFYGNSNLEYFLKDYTSNFERRYWIMEADGEIHDKQWWDEHLTDEYCQQVLAEIKYFYDNNSNFNYTNLSIEETEELRKVQYRHKTLNNDDLLQYEILEMLNKNFTKDEFESFKEFYAEATNNDIFSGNLETDDEFFGEKLSKKYKKINKIPTKWVKFYIEKVQKRVVSTQYITALLSLNWSYKVAKYNKIATNCYIRI